jgi:glycosyltransferase involved in cell wall biosynthesis
VTFQPTVSVLICNYNYERFVGQAIASALAQTWQHTEVVVVDDGSSDGSWQVIGSFGDKVRAIRRANGGQGAAYNTALQAGRGDWVIWLDSDDLLDADCIARCVEQMDQGIHKVAFRMRVIDADGRPSGNNIPFTLHRGDVRDTLLRFGFYAGPPGSGNLYRRASIEPFFPLDEKLWAMGADTVPFMVAAAAGPVAAIDGPLASYRVHRSRSGSDAGVFGNEFGTPADALIKEDHRRGQALRMIAPLLGHDGAAPWLLMPTHVRTRVISWRTARAAHPYAGDSAWSLMQLVWRSVAAWPGYRALERATLVGWAAGVLWLPRPLVTRLVQIGASAAVKMRLRER